MSTHDRGAFGALLAEAKALGCNSIEFFVDFDMPDESDERWFVTGFKPRRGSTRRRAIQDLVDPLTAGIGQGRTGEEALRRLVEKMRG